MKIFLSWSGDRSKAVAIVFADWIKCVLQAIKPWISSRDIDRGAVWFSEIGDQLNGVSMGIVFLTRENRERPWILFESGALYKGLDTRVCTLLVDLQPADVQAPLGQFNHTTPTSDSMRQLVYTLNARLPVPLEDQVMEQVFAVYWPQFERDFNRALEDTAGDAGPTPIRSDQNLLAEILENTRSLGKRMGALEQRVSAGSSSDGPGGITLRRTVPSKNVLADYLLLHPDLTAKQTWNRLAALMDNKELQQGNQDQPEDNSSRGA